jgi:DNA-directed RNA polymerase subunit beta
MGQDEIRRVFKDDIYILDTLYSEPYNHLNILDDPEIIGIRKTANDLDGRKTSGRGSPIDSKLKEAVVEYVHKKKEADELRTHYETMFAKIANEHEALTNQLNKATGAKKTELEQQIKALTAGVEKTLDRLTTIEHKLRALIDIMITEKAAKDLISALSISVKSIETYASSVKETISYQDVLVRHFMDPRQYDLTNAGRYKMQRKLRASERLYQRIIAEDILDKQDKILIPKGTMILKDELAIIKNAMANNNLKLFDEIKIANQNMHVKKQTKMIESILVYTDNDVLDIITPIIGPLGLIESNALTLVDFISAISYTVGLPHNIGQYDDIDHLGNKRLRLIHEQLKNKLQIGMARVERHTKEKLASISIPTANEEQQKKVEAKTTIKLVVNTKAFQLVVKKFFNSYQLTQFIDQQNPLSELTNKRRISAMGDGGISRDDPNLDIRDVHYSHYGRICPIETPEGMNIGLIMSLSALARVDDKGFLITPYRKVVKGVIKDEIEWMTSLREDEYVICEATVKVDENNKILDKKVVGRYRSTQELFDVDKVDYIDVSPRQVVSIAAGAIPFLENDDPTRALMGANMQRQAVPLLVPYAPMIGTGSEYKIAHDSGMTLVADEDGEIISVDGNKIMLETKDGNKSTYKLIKYRKSNQDTCINQTPLVKVGQKIKKGDVLTDGPAMQNGELALGRNPLVAFTT